MADQDPLSPQLRAVEAFLDGTGERSPEWPVDPVEFSDFIVGELQTWFRNTPATLSYLCATFIPATAAFLLTTPTEPRVSPLILNSEFTGDPQNSVALVTRVAGCFDWISVMAAKLSVKPDHHLYDIGANIGTETIPFAKLVPQGKVVAFEPEPRNADWIEQNLQLNDLSNVTVLRAAASDVAEKLQPGGYSENNTGLVHVTLSETEGMEAVIPDQVYEQNQKAPVGYLHIDVEGFETKVLRGAQQLIQECHPAIYIEAQRAWLERAETSVDELYEILCRPGYDVFRISRGGGTLEPLAAEQLDSVIDENWLAIPNDESRDDRVKTISETFGELSRNSESFREFFSL